MGMPFGVVHSSILLLLLSISRYRYLLILNLLDSLDHTTSQLVTWYTHYFDQHFGTRFGTKELLWFGQCEFDTVPVHSSKCWWMIAFHVRVRYEVRWFTMTWRRNVQFLHFYDMKLEKGIRLSRRPEWSFKEDKGWNVVEDQTRSEAS